MLELDHIDPDTKTYNVSKMVSSMHFSLDRIKVEIRKCQVLCANCHRIKTLEEREIKWHLYLEEED